MPAPPAELLERFRADLEALGWADRDRIGVAVSGGPDSLALLLLAAAALPGRVRAATVDHRLRPESAAEATEVANICSGLGVAHRVLRLEWPDPPRSNLQARARAARYAALAEWAAGEGLAALATAHHLDDQAETLLLRLARGSGAGGLAGIRAASLVPGTGIRLLRPLLGWRKAELEAIVAAAGLGPARDPANADPRFDRTRARRLLADTSWLSADRLAAAAAHFAQSNESLEWAVRRLWGERASVGPDGAVTIDSGDLPIELQRRLLLKAFRSVGAADPPGPKLVRLLDALRAGRPATLAGLSADPGPPWRLRPAPPRRRS